jgi:hypothetical protein
MSWYARLDLEWSWPWAEWLRKRRARRLVAEGKIALEEFDAAQAALGELMEEIAANDGEVMPSDGFIRHTVDVVLRHARAVARCEDLNKQVEEFKADGKTVQDPARATAAPSGVPPLP